MRMFITTTEGTNAANENDDNYNDQGCFADYKVALVSIMMLNLRLTPHSRCTCKIQPWRKVADDVPGNDIEAVDEDGEDYYNDNHGNKDDDGVYDSSDLVEDGYGVVTHILCDESRRWSWRVMYCQSMKLLIEMLDNSENDDSTMATMSMTCMFAIMPTSLIASSQCTNCNMGARNALAWKSRTNSSTRLFLERLQKK